jgi:hypothetical protein
MVTIPSTRRAAVTGRFRTSAAARDRRPGRRHAIDRPRRHVFSARDDAALDDHRASVQRTRLRGASATRVPHYTDQLVSFAPKTVCTCDPTAAKAPGVLLMDGDYVGCLIPVFTIRVADVVPALLVVRRARQVGAQAPRVDRALAVGRLTDLAGGVSGDRTVRSPLTRVAGQLPCGLNWKLDTTISCGLAGGGL